MKKIFKYQAGKTTGEIIIKVPLGSVFLSVDNQGETITFWFIVDDGIEVIEQKRFLSLMTGQEVDFRKYDSTNFLKTLLLDSGAFVLHIWEIIE